MHTFKPQVMHMLSSHGSCMHSDHRLHSYWSFSSQMSCLCTPGQFLPPTPTSWPFSLLEASLWIKFRGGSKFWLDQGHCPCLHSHLPSAMGRTVGYCAVPLICHGSHVGHHRSCPQRGPRPRSQQTGHLPVACFSPSDAL